MLPSWCTPCLFQSTLPGWGATRLISDEVAQANEFQSTLPGWGATCDKLTVFSGAGISIHAPRMGSDTADRAPTHRPSNFNPRSPDGERLRRDAAIPQHGISIHAPRMGSDASAAQTAAESAKFQSTLPGWGATPAPRTSTSSKRFQSTLPGWGATEPVLPK